MSYYLKDPDATSDHAIDWTDYLDGRTIVASSWSVEPAEAGGIAIVEASFEGGRAAVRLFGGIVGHAYCIANRVTLSNGSSDDRSVTLRVEQR